MRLTEFAVKYRVTTTMFFLGIVIIGIISLARLNVSLLPDIEFPKVTVITAYTNASPQEIRNLVTRPMEEALSSVSGIKKIESKSNEGLSIVTLTFNWGNDMDIAILNVSENAERIRTFLPQDVEKPIVIKFDPASKPIFIVSVFSKTIAENYLKRFISKEIKTKFERIKGVGSVSLVGGRDRIIDVEADLNTLFSYQVKLSDIMNSISTSNIDFPAGNIEKGETEFLIRTMGRFNTIKDIEKVVVKADEKGVPIYLHQIAKVNDTLKELSSVAMINGRETIAMEIKKEAGANTVDVCDKLKVVLAEVQEKYSDRIELNVIQDSSVFINDAIQNVYNEGIFGALLAFLILLFFLQNMRSALIIVVSMPISIISTFIFMYMAGISLNMMSLGGLALGIGILVDNSIVVIENIERERKKGLSAKQACLEGTKTVHISIIGSTVTTIIVFLPLIFVKGLIGALFKEMAYTITFSLLSSILTAIYLVPMLYSLEKPQTKKKTIHHISFFKAVFKISDLFYNFMEHRYIQTFSKFFKRKRFFLFLSFALFLVSVVIFINLNSELMPKVKEPYLNLWLKMPEGTTVESTRDISKVISQKIKSYPFTTMVITTIGFEEENIVAKIDDKIGKNMANFTIYLNEDYSIQKAYDQLEKEVIEKRAEKMVFSQPPDIVSKIISQQDKPILVQIEGKHVDSIKDSAIGFAAKLINIPGLKNINLSLDEGKPEIKVKIDRDKMASFGLNVEAVSVVLRSALEGEKISRYQEGDNNIDIRVRLKKDNRNSLKALESIFIPTPENVFIPLSKIATLVRGIGTEKILRENQSDLIQIFADFDESVFSSYGKAKLVVEKQIKEMLKTNKNQDIYDVSLKGENETYQESFSQLVFMFIFSILFIYMIVASLFESLISPFLLMLSIPLALIGVAPVLLITGLSLNIMSGMGLIMLGGIIINNAILLLEFVYQEEEKGSNLKDSIFNAGVMRLKPIIVSVLTIVMGSFPLALGIGSGGDMQQPMAVTLISGVMMSTFLTLFLFPTMYYIYKNFVYQRKDKIKH